MDQATLIAFVASFAVGPALCAALLQLNPRTWTLAVIAGAVVVSITTALRWQLKGPDMQAQSLIMLWLAWVLAVAMVGLAIKARVANNRARRWLLVLALLATTLPWFGMATARALL